MLTTVESGVEEVATQRFLGFVGILVMGKEWPRRCYGQNKDLGTRCLSHVIS